MRHALGAFGGLLDVAGDFLGGGVLLLDRGGDRGGDVVHLPHLAADRGDALDRALGGGLNAADLGADFLGGLGGLVGEVLHLGSDDRETLAGLASAGGFDRGVERQEVGLL